MNSIKASNIEKVETNLNKSEMNIKSIKSKFILKKIFEYEHKVRILKLFKYNKYFQNIINIKPEDYIYYSEIEIEVVPLDKRNGRIIYIVNENDKPYYHIFLNDDKEEYEYYYLPNNRYVNKIRIIIDYQVTCLNYLFFYCKNIQEINFIRFYRNNITDMRRMFEKCKFLTKLNLTNFNTKNVTDMSCMFEKCQSLTKLDLSNFDTKNVTNMSFMFYDCYRLEELNLANFNTKNVTNMNCFFDMCYALKRLNISDFIINKETKTYRMFIGCPTEMQMDLKMKFPTIRDDIFDLLYR